MFNKSIPQHANNTATIVNVLPIYKRFFIDAGNDSGYLVSVWPMAHSEIIKTEKEFTKYFDQKDYQITYNQKVENETVLVYLKFSNLETKTYFLLLQQMGKFKGIFFPDPSQFDHVYEVV